MRLTCILAITIIAAAALADEPTHLEALAQMPVREVTAFKDGHALIVHSGQMPVDSQGNVVMDYLPTPVLGTFWPSALGANVKLQSVTSRRRKVSVPRTAITLHELIEANVGKHVTVTERLPGSVAATGPSAPSEPRESAFLRYSAMIESLPARGGDELDRTSPPNSEPMLTQKGDVVLLRTDEGLKVVPLARIEDITLKDEQARKVMQEEFRNLLTLHLKWENGRSAEKADVGLMYVQRGIRWIPNYRVDIDGAGKATLKLQATVINELLDLENVTLNLVVGVPTFAFADQADPISLQQDVARLAAQMRGRENQYNYLSNTIMTQTGYMRAAEPSAQPGGPAVIDLGPELAGSTRREDLYVYTIKNVTLGKGGRMVLPVVEFTLPYVDVYTLNMPVTPPPEVWRNISDNRQADAAKLLERPKAMHVIRLENKSEYPLTTAPALIFRQGKVLAQGLMTYTPVGGKGDLPLTAAVDIAVRKEDQRITQDPSTITWAGSSYVRIDMKGLVRLGNHRKEAVELEVSRNVLGIVDECDHEGRVTMLDLFEDTGVSAGPDGRPWWWTSYSWPWWWHHLNGASDVKWKIQLKPGETVELGYAWHYFWSR